VGAIIGWVGDQPVPRSLLDQRIADLREGPLRAALPVPGSSEDRQLARWLTQVILTESLCESAAAELGLSPHVEPSRSVTSRPDLQLTQHPATLPSPPNAHDDDRRTASTPPHSQPEHDDHRAAGTQPDTQTKHDHHKPADTLAGPQTEHDDHKAAGTLLDRVAAVELGSINAAAYNGSRWVRAMFQHVTAAVTVPPEWREPAARREHQPLHLVQHRLFTDRSRASAATESDLVPLGAVTLDSLPSAIAGAIGRRPYGTLVGPVEDALGWHVAVATPAPVPQEPATPRLARQEHMPNHSALSPPTPSPSAHDRFVSGTSASGSSTHDTTASRVSASGPSTHDTTAPSASASGPSTHGSTAPGASTSRPSGFGSSTPDSAATGRPAPELGAVERGSSLVEAARRRAFARWLDDMRAQRVRLIPGLEHPGDPRQPDNHHKH
jgi:[acyl-carrier-protein] S-malonyltransferase